MIQCVNSLLLGHAAGAAYGSVVKTWSIQKEGLLTTHSMPVGYTLQASQVSMPFQDPFHERYIQLNLLTLSRVLHIDDASRTIWGLKGQYGIQHGMLMPKLHASDLSRRHTQCTAFELTIMKQNKGISATSIYP